MEIRFFPDWGSVHRRPFSGPWVLWGRQTDELEGQGGQGAHMGLGVGPGIQLL